MKQIIIHITTLNPIVLPGTSVNESGLYTLRIHPAGMGSVAALEVASHSLEEITQWKQSIQDAIVNLSENQLKLQKEVKRLQIAKEMSDLIVYCRSVPFEMDSKCVCPSVCVYSRDFIVILLIFAQSINFPWKLIYFHEKQCNQKITMFILQCLFSTHHV